MNQLAGAVEVAAAWEVAVAVEGNGAECHLEVEAAGAVWGSEDVFFFLRLVIAFRSQASTQIPRNLVT